MLAKVTIGVALSVFGAHCSPHYHTAPAPKAPAVMYQCVTQEGHTFFTDNPASFSPAFKCAPYDVTFHGGLEHRGCSVAGKPVASLPSNTRKVECVK